MEHSFQSPSREMEWEQLSLQRQEDLANIDRIRGIWQIGCLDNALTLQLAPDPSKDEGSLIVQELLMLAEHCSCQITAQAALVTVIRKRKAMLLYTGQTLWFTAADVVQARKAIIKEEIKQGQQVSTRFLLAPSSEGVNGSEKKSRAAKLVYNEPVISWQMERLKICLSSLNKLGRDFRWRVDLAVLESELNLADDPAIPLNPKKEEHQKLVGEIADYLKNIEVNLNGLYQGLGRLRAKLWLGGELPVGEGE